MMNLEDNPKYKKVVKVIEILNSGYIPAGHSGIEIGNIFRHLGIMILKDSD
jgi:hypothetical protein